MLRIVVPVLNEGATLRSTLSALAPLRQRGAEVVVVDGGSTDSTWAEARARCDALICAPAGRASQMNAGANSVSSAGRPRIQTLLFLHADTRLPPDADRLVEQALQAGASWGRFDVSLDSPQPLLRLVEWMMNMRSRSSGIATGDQALFVRRSVFDAVGGFADIPLMEDIELSTRLRRHSPPVCLRARVQTSARRWERYGVWRTIVLMWRLRAAYFFGTPPTTLAQRYGYAPRPSAVTAAVAVLAKAPIAGYSKTRLIPLLGAGGAARAQRSLCFLTLHTARASAMPTQLWCAPHAQARFFRALAKRGDWHCLTQTDGHLGQRMSAICESHFVHHPEQPLLLIGTDCPVLAPGHLQQAARSLLQHDAVLIPAQDGGYVLLGLRRMLPQVFENIDWSTSVVLEQTRARLRACAATWLELPTLWDIDEPSDWLRWQNQMSSA